MVNLYTEVKIPKTQTVINYNSNLMFVGSCFANNIGEMFFNMKFRCLANPLGTLYNPLSINILFDILTSDKKITDDDFFKNGNQYSSYLMHGDYSNEDLSCAVTNANKSISTARNFLKNSDIVFITFGTAFVYYLNQNKMPVANCHKQNPNLFTRRMLSVEQSSVAIKNICQTITHYHHDAKIVLTVSPIRHIADGATDNTLSKSTLLLSVADTVKKLENVEYFPSFEIMIDELRDYRFYESNLTHPSAMAREIIFNKLITSFCSKDTINQISNVANFMKSVNHKITSPDSPDTIKFAQCQLQKAMQLEAQNFGLDLSKEKKYFTEIINK